MTKTHAEESLGANPGDAALNPADSVAMGVASSSAPREPSGSPTRERGTFQALRHRAFRLLFAAFMINQTGFWISHISLQGLMVELSHNDTRQNGLLFFALFIPAFLLAPLAGVAADRFDRKTIVLSCYVSIALCCAGLTLLTAREAMTPERLLIVSLVMGMSFAFSGPANHAIAANTVPTDDLASAISLQSAANNLTRVVGPLLAAPFVATSRFEWSFAIYLAAASIAGILTAVMKIQAYEPDSEDSGIFARMRGGLQHAAEREPALPALSVVAVMSLVGVSHVVLIPAFAQDVLGDKTLFAWLVAATGVGAVAGALRSGNIGTVLNLRRGSLGLAAYGVSLAAFALSTTALPALLAQMAVGYFYFSVMTTLQTLIQQLVDEGKRGRVMSLFQVSWAGLVPFGSLAMGYLAGPIGTPTTLLLAAALCTLYGGVVTLLSNRWPTHGEAEAAT